MAIRADATILLEFKVCLACGLRFTRPPHTSNSRWKRRKACSHSCTTALVNVARRQKALVPVEDRLRLHLNKSVGHGPNGDCWVWTAHRNRDGYGRIGVPGKRGASELAHRVSFRIANGDFDPAMKVCHRCDNPPCCNPAHLFLGSPADNMIDMARKGRGRKPKGRT